MSTWIHIGHYRSKTWMCISACVSTFGLPSRCARSWILVGGWLDPGDFHLLFVNIPKLFVDSGCIDCGIIFFISAFLPSVSPSYLWIRHAFWDLPCLKGFHQEIYPLNSGQFFPIGFQDVGSKFSRRFSGRNILKKLFYLLGGQDIYIYLSIYLYLYR